MLISFRTGLGSQIKFLLAFCVALAGFLFVYSSVFAGGAPASGFSVHGFESVSESAGTIEVPVTLTGLGAGSYSLDYETVDETALAGGDYVAASGTIHFTDSGTQYITITINNDSLHEDNETFEIHYSNPVGTTIAADSGSITEVSINNDDFDVYKPVTLLGHIDEGGEPIWDDPSAGTDSTHFKINESMGSVAVDLVHHRLFATDYTNNRVLVFLLDSTNDLADREADYVLGQSGLMDSGSALTASGMYSPTGLAYDPDGDRLFVSDSSNNRILIFDTTTIENGENALHVLGNDSLVTGVTPGTSDTKLISPAGLLFDSERNYLYVADMQNYRVLVFDVASITDGEAAIHVLGQPDFDTAGTGTADDEFYEPQALAYDPENKYLFVADTSNSRVLVFDVASITDGEAAIHVLGQADYGSGSSDVTATRMSSPRGLVYDSLRHRLFVGDKGNGRVLGFDFSDGVIENGQAATWLLGQEDFDESGISVYTAQGTMNYNSGLELDPQRNRLYSVDGRNNRINVFDFVLISTESLVNGTTGEAYSDGVSVSSATGTLSFAISSGALPSGLTLNSTTGTITGTPTSSGDFTFSVTVTDNNPFVGADFVDTKEYTISVEAGSEDAPEFVLSEVTPIPSSTTIARAIYRFGANDAVEESEGGDYVFTGCDNASVDASLHTVTFSNLHVGDTIECTFQFAEGENSSNSLQIGPFTVISSASSGGGSGIVMGQAVNMGQSFGVTQHVSSAPAAPEILRRTLRLGMSGDDVFALQVFLNTHGHTIALSGTGSRGKESHYFGTLTKKAVIKFQKDQGLGADGVVGPKTWEKIKKLSV